jgi:hypothetical protein
MAPTAAQFSPGQILDAGRRAENDGRVGYAIQFYRHLTDHHGWSPEAAIAKEALARLANFRPAADAAANGGPAQHVSPAQQPSPPQQWQTPGPMSGQPPPPGPAPAPGIVNGWPPNGGTPVSSPSAPAPHVYSEGLSARHAETASSRPPLRLPAAERRYRIGSAVAWLLFGIGLVLTVGGMVFAGLHVIGLKVPGTLGTMLGFTGGLPGALAISALGVMQVFASQIGRALFDNANAMRDLSMIERAKISHAAGDQPFSDDDEPA